jgi:hypothetical protein
MQEILDGTAFWIGLTPAATLVELEEIAHGTFTMLPRVTVDELVKDRDIALNALYDKCGDQSIQVMRLITMYIASG